MNNFKETIEKLSKTNWKVKGACTQAIVEYLKLIGKGDQISKIEKRMQEYGFEINLEKVNPFKMYPIAMELALIFSIKEILNWGEKEIKELGRNTPKFSFIVKILMKYFISPQRSYKESPVYWKTHFNFGLLETPEFNDKEKYYFLRIKNFDIHPLYCVFLAGYFEAISSFMFRVEKTIWSQEIKCTFKGDPYHEFKISWQ